MGRAEKAELVEAAEQAARLAEDPQWVEVGRGGEAGRCFDWEERPLIEDLCPPGFHWTSHFAFGMGPVITQG